MIDDTGKGGGKVMMAAPVGSCALQKVVGVARPRAPSTGTPTVGDTQNLAKPNLPLGKTCRVFTAGKLFW